MTALTPQASPRELIPGNPESAEALAALLERYAQGLSDGAAQLRGLDDGPWAGPAAESFRSRLGVLPARMATGGEAFAPSGRAMRQYAATLREGQAEAGKAIELAREAQRQSAHYQTQLAAYAQELAGGDPAMPAPPAVDPGAETQAQAERMLAAARQRVDEADAYTANILRAAAEQAPDQPSFWHDLWWGVKQFGIGFKESVVGMGKFLYHLSPVYRQLHPVEAHRFYQRLGQSFIYGIQHPVEFGKAMIDWETWQENPARAIGHLGPDAILALASGGTALAAKGGIRGLRSAKKLEGVAGAARHLASPVPGGTRPAIHAGSADPATLKKVFQREYGEVKEVNAERLAMEKPGHDTNCTRCVVATDHIIDSGDPSSALPSEADKISVIADHFGAKWQPKDSYDDIVAEMQDAGEGARGIVAGARKNGPGHVFNVVHDDNGVVFIDGQSGEFAQLEQYESLRLLRTN